MPSLDPSPPLITVVVPVFNDAPRLRKCLAALARQTGASVPSFEVVVGDNGSTDVIDEVLSEFPQVRRVLEPRPGSYQARNAAAAAAQGVWLAFTDSDCVPADDWLSCAAGALRRAPSIDLFVGEIDLFDETEDGQRHEAVSAYEQATSFQQRYYAMVYGFGPTANLFVRASVFRSMAGFDTDRRSGGDKEFGQRATRAGHRLAYEPTIRVAHPMRSQVAALEDRVRRLVGGESFAAREDPRRAWLDWLRYLVLRPIRASILILRNRDLRLAQRLAAFTVIPRVAMWQIHERIRLMGGGEPRR